MCKEAKVKDDPFGIDPSKTVYCRSCGDCGCVIRTNDPNEDSCVDCFVAYVKLGEDPDATQSDYDELGRKLRGLFLFRDRC
jgi:hypothetical protein